jgi:thiamine transport system permease protein
VAIYQSLRMDFDPARALALSLVQVALTTALIGFAQAGLQQDKGFVPLRQTGSVLVEDPPALQAANFALIALAALMVVPLLAILVVAGAAHLHFTGATIAALGTSLVLGVASATIAMFLAWPLAKRSDAASHLTALAGLLVPPAIVATGWFLLLHRLGDSLWLTFAFIAALNAMIALPYATANLRSGQARVAPLVRLQQQLGLQGFVGFRIVELPLLRRALAQAFLMALVMSLGDLTAITLLGSNNIVTLPTLMHAEMGHYRSADAAGTALVLLLLCGLLTIAAQKIGEPDAQT